MVPRRRRAYEIAGVVLIVLVALGVRLYLDQAQSPAGLAHFPPIVVFPAGAIVNLTAQCCNWYPFTINASGTLQGTFSVSSGDTIVLVCTAIECGTGAVYNGPQDTVYESGKEHSGTLAVTINQSGDYGFGTLPTNDVTVIGPQLLVWATALEFVYS